MPLVDEKILKCFPDLFWGACKKENLSSIQFSALPPENLEALQIAKINLELWSKKSHKTKTFNTELHTLQNIARRRKCIALELNHTYRQISYSPGGPPYVVVLASRKLSGTYQKQIEYFTSKSLQRNCQNNLLLRGRENLRERLRNLDQIPPYQRNQGQAQHQ